MNVFIRTDDSAGKIRDLREEISRLNEQIGALQASDEKRKAAEEAIRASSEMLRLVIDNIPQHVFWKDLNSVYLGCNKNFLRAAGVERPGDIIGKTDYDLAWTRAEAEAFRRDDREVMDNDRPIYHIIEPQMQADGRQSWLDTNKVPMHDAEGRVVGILGTYEDITERKLAETRLEEAKSQAELYVDLMSHDIGNMDQAMLGYLEMAVDTLRPEGADKALLTQPLEIIKNSTRLINNVRKLRQLQEGELSAGKVDLGEVLSEVKTDFSSVPGRDVRIEYNPVSGCIVEANDMLKDLFANLIDNAIRHSSGNLRIGIGLSKIALGRKECYRIAVEDNGPGISDELKEKLLTAARGGSGKAERRGIGLLLVKVLLENFHGALRIEDRVPGDYRKGSRFIVLLPVAI